jgi:hypothetical protein
MKKKKAGMSLDEVFAHSEKDPKWPSLMREPISKFAWPYRLPRPGRRRS